MKPKHLLLITGMAFMGLLQGCGSGETAGQRIDAQNTGAEIYSASHHFQLDYGMWPQNFNQLLGDNPREYVYLSGPEVLVCPFDPEKQIGYQMVQQVGPPEDGAVLFYGVTPIKDGRRIVARINQGVDFELYTPESE